MSFDKEINLSETQPLQASVSFNYKYENKNT